MKTTRSLGIGLACAALLATAAPSPAQQLPTITFGAPISMTGKIVPEGKAEHDGFEFWKDYVNIHGGILVGGTRYRVNIVYRDDQSSPAGAAAAAEKLLAVDRVQFLLGPYSSELNLAVAPIAEVHATPLIVCGGSSEKIYNQGYKYVFGVLSPARKYLVGIIEMASKRTPKIQTAAIVNSDDTFSVEAANAAAESANNHGIRVVYRKTYANKTDNVDDVAEGIAAAHPDMILDSGHYDDSVLLHKTLRAKNVEAKIYGYTVGPDQPAFRETLGKSANYVFGGTQFTTGVKYAGAAGFLSNAASYGNLFEAQYHYQPGHPTASCTAAGLAYQYALQNAGTLDAAKVRQALADLDVTTFYGRLKFDARGANDTKPMVVLQIQDGRIVTVYPYRIAESAPKYPTPTWALR